MMGSFLETFWYIIIIVSIAAYAMLDGFDLGVGILHLCVRKDEERRIFLNAIGPIWDGNEVWLVVVIGALFAGFPIAYALIFSAFYIPLVVLIVGLIFRAVAIEFRSRRISYLWRTTWDISFFLGSLFIAFLIGVGLGNLIHGIPLDSQHDFIKRELCLFCHPYASLVGLFAVSLFVVHGIIFLVMKTEGVLQQKIERWLKLALPIFIVLYAMTTLATLIYEPHMTEHFRARPYLLVVALLNIVVIVNIFREVQRGKMGFAFISSCANIALLLTLFALSTYPALIHSTRSPETSLTIHDAAASTTTLTVLSIIVAIGVPLVIAYGYFIYRLFRGKVKLDSMSY